MESSKIQDTIHEIERIDFDIRWIEKKIEKNIYNPLRNLEHQKDIANRTLVRLKERYNKQVEKLKIY